MLIEPADAAAEEKKGLWTFNALISDWILYVFVFKKSDIYPGICFLCCRELNIFSLIPLLMGQNEILIIIRKWADQAMKNLYFYSSCPIKCNMDNNGCFVWKINVSVCRFPLYFSGVKISYLLFNYFSLQCFKVNRWMLAWL